MFVYVINEVFVFIDNRYHLVEEKSSILYKSRVCKGYLQSGQNHSNSCLTSKMRNFYQTEYPIKYSHILLSQS